MIDLRLGDCLKVMRSLPDCSVDAVVTDPPYGLGFMRERWDNGIPAPDVWAECLRVLKPGSHLLAFAGTKTQHRMAANIEDAGFEIRDMIAWIYGSGFPKSKNLDGDWDGWGTALKPALEPITVARKPLAGTIATNVMAHGTGAINIDGCRVPPINGRWPANVVHDGSNEIVALFPDGTSGAMKSGTRRAAQDEPGSVCYGVFGGNATNKEIKTSSGSAARFFYCAKANNADREDGCEPITKKLFGISGAAAAAAARGENYDNGDGGVNRTKLRRNNHPTVKPTDLMAYLCRLVTPPGGLVLDPFMGSGSTGRGAVLEGFDFVGIEREADYFSIAKLRVAAAQQLYDNEHRQLGLELDG